MAGEIPSPEDLIERARAMIPTLAARSEQGERERNLPAATALDLQRTGLLRAMRSKRWGGYEMSPKVFLEIQRLLGQGDMSTAWVYGIYGSVPFMLAFFDDQASADVWRDDPDAIVCVALPPTGQAERVDGGFRFSGRWKYASGSMHGRWGLFGGLATNQDGSPPDHRLFLIPPGAFKVIDTWHVTGLAGTGSHDVVVEDVFVPEYRTHKIMDAYHLRGPGKAVNTSLIYRIPFGQIFLRGTTGALIGALQGMFNAFLDYGKVRVGRIGKMSEDPVALLACAEAAAGIDEMIEGTNRVMDVLETYAARNEVPSQQERMKFKFQSSLASERCTQLALRLLKAVGTTGLSTEYPFVRFVNDINAGRSHFSQQYEFVGRNWGGTLLGNPARPDYMV